MYNRILRNVLWWLSVIHNMNKICSSCLTVIYDIRIDILLNQDWFNCQVIFIILLFSLSLSVPQYSYPFIYVHHDLAWLSYITKSNQNTQRLLFYYIFIWALNQDKTLVKRSVHQYTSQMYYQISIGISLQQVLWVQLRKYGHLKAISFDVRVLLRRRRQ